MVDWRTSRLLLLVLFLMGTVVAMSVYVRYDLSRFDMMQMFFEDGGRLAVPSPSTSIVINESSRISQAYPKVNITEGQQPLFAK